MFLPYLRSSAHPPTLNDILTLQSPVVTCTAQCSLYVPHSGHYMYRTLVTICTAQWSQHLPHSSHYMYRTVVIMNRTVVTICTAQLLQHVPHSGHYVPHSGHYMYRTVVTTCTAQWSLCTAQWSPYVPPALSTQCIYVFCVDLRTNWGNFLHGFNIAVNFCASGKADCDMTMGMDGACKGRASGRDLATFKQTNKRFLDYRRNIWQTSTVTRFCFQALVSEWVSQSYTYTARLHTALYELHNIAKCRLVQRSWNLRPKCVEVLSAFALTLTAGKSCSSC